MTDTPVFDVIRTHPDESQARSPEAATGATGWDCEGETRKASSNYGFGSRQNMPELLDVVITKCACATLCAN